MLLYLLLRRLGRAAKCSIVLLKRTALSSSPDRGLVKIIKRPVSLLTLKGESLKLLVVARLIMTSGCPVPKSLRRRVLTAVLARAMLSLSTWKCCLPGSLVMLKAKSGLATGMPTSIGVGRWKAVVRTVLPIRWP